MKNKRFLSITMVLLTALFVFAFAAVTKTPQLRQTRLTELQLLPMKYTDLVMYQQPATGPR